MTQQTTAEQQEQRRQRPQGWSYQGETGPSRWVLLRPDYAACHQGKEQSPINITAVTSAALAPLEFSYKEDLWKITDNGHTVSVEIPSGSVVEIRGTTYQLTQFHFHARAENLLDGQQHDMELHLVHEDQAGNLAVVGVWLQGGGADHPALAKVWSHIPGTKQQQATITDDALNPGDLLPRDQSYFNWAGSLTTPPCAEGVDWNMLKTPLVVSDAQIATFRSLYSDNYRPVQALNGRTISG